MKCPKCNSRLRLQVHKLAKTSFCDNPQCDYQEDFDDRTKSVTSHSNVTIAAEQQEKEYNGTI